jgi:hypothetical protein
MRDPFSFSMRRRGREHAGRHRLRIYRAGIVIDLFGQSNELFHSSGSHDGVFAANCAITPDGAPS